MTPIKWRYMRKFQLISISVESVLFIVERFIQNQVYWIIHEFREIRVYT